MQETQQSLSQPPLEFIRVVMLREDLIDIPPLELPAGYALRPYREGDRDTWMDIERASESFRTIEDDLFEKQFGDDLAEMPARCRFLVGPDGSDVGTITAWFDNQYGGKCWGRVHWVAIRPEHRGRGLARPMVAATMRQMVELGHRRSILDTQTPRLPAIRVYLDLGFVPDMTYLNAADAWRRIRAYMDHPVLAGLDL
jgi:GNAT superfamily N-acetyltransferase